MCTNFMYNLSLVIKSAVKEEKHTIYIYIYKIQDSTMYNEAERSSQNKEIRDFVAWAFSGEKGINSVFTCIKTYICTRIIL